MGFPVFTVVGKPSFSRTVYVVFMSARSVPKESVKIEVLAPGSYRRRVGRNVSSLTEAEDVGIFSMTDSSSLGGHDRIECMPE